MPWSGSVGEPSGVVRAFDALTGEFAWAWDMGRPGIHTQPLRGEVYTRGTPNVWSIFSVDEELGLIYAPTGNETPDYFGGYRMSSMPVPWLPSMARLVNRAGFIRQCTMTCGTGTCPLNPC